LPFDASDTMQLLYAQVHEPPPPLASVLPEVAPAVAAAVEAMLAKDPAARPTMADVAATMAQLGGSMSSMVPVKAEPSAPTLHLASPESGSRVVGEVARRTEVLRPPSRLPWVLGLVAAVVLIGGATVTALLVRGGGAHPPVVVAPSPARPPAVAVPCGRFVDFFVPTPPGLSLLSCFDANGLGTLTFTGFGNPSYVCAPMKQWATNLGWVRDSERATATTESLALHRDRERLTLLCTASGGTTTVSISLAPRS